MGKITTLHIGTTKTGSTSIQDFLARNRTALTRNSVLYPEALGSINHNAIPVYLQGKLANSRIQAKYKIKTTADYEAFVSERPSILAAEIQEHAPDHIIISSEHLHSRCYTNVHFARVKELLAPALTGRKLRIVIYLRPQISHAVSLYSTMLRHGSTETIDGFISGRMSGRGHAYFNFDKLLKRWSSAFPQATFIVRSFAKVGNLPHGVLSDFLDVADLAHLSDEMTFEPRQNESMGAWSAEALRQLNALDKPLPPSLNHRARQWLRYEVQAGRVIPDIDTARKFQNSFSKGNARVCKDYFGGDLSAFDVDWSKYEKPVDPQGITPQQLITLLMKIAK